MFSDHISGVQTNALQARFEAYSSPEIRALYDEAARHQGHDLRKDLRLTPLVLSDATKMADDTATHPATWVSLNPDIPEQTLRVYFQDSAFIRRVTCTVKGLVLNPGAIAGVADTPAAPFEPQILTQQAFGSTDPKDFVYAQFYRDGSQQLFHDRKLPLSEVTGNQAHGYFFRPIPLVTSGGSIQVDLSIRPPLNENISPPPFVNRVGQVVLSFHCERFNAFGV